MATVHSTPMVLVNPATGASIPRHVHESLNDGPWAIPRLCRSTAVWLNPPEHWVCEVERALEGEIPGLTEQQQLEAEEFFEGECYRGCGMTSNFVGEGARTQEELVHRLGLEGEAEIQQRFHEFQMSQLVPVRPSPVTAVLPEDPSARFWAARAVEAGRVNLEEEWVAPPECDQFTGWDAFPLKNQKDSRPSLRRIAQEQAQERVTCGPVRHRPHRISETRSSRRPGR